MQTAIDSEFNNPLGRNLKQKQITLVMSGKLDLEPLNKEDECAVCFIYGEENVKDYQFTMVPTPTCPAGTRAAIRIVDGCYSIIKVVTTDFISRHALMDFLHYVLNVDLEDLHIHQIQGFMGSVRRPIDRSIFDNLFGSEDELEKELS